MPLAMAWRGIHELQVGDWVTFVEEQDHPFRGDRMFMVTRAPDSRGVDLVGALSEDNSSSGVITVQNVPLYLLCYEPRVGRTVLNSS
jgi:hypothetical protein